MPVDKYGIDREEVSDLVRFFDEAEPDDAAQPGGGKPRATPGEQDWQRKVAEEDRQQHKTEARSRRRIWGMSLRRRAGPQKKKKKHGAALARVYRMRVAAQVAPWAALLLAAPFISGPGGFYLLALLTAVPATAAALLLRPLGPKAWVLRALVPLLPVEAHFALRYFAWDPGMTLALVSVFALSGSLYYIFGLRGKGPGRDTSRPETRNAQLELELKGRRQARRARSDDEKQAAKGYGRRFLLFVVPLMCVSLLIPALSGFVMQLRRPAPNVIREGSLEEQSLTDAALMARRMISAYEHLQAGAWSDMNRRAKLAALQALLDVETDRMEIKGSDGEIQRFDLRDPAVLAAASGPGHTSIAAALLSGSAKAELRVRAICHLAYHLKQLTLFNDVNIHLFEAQADAYEDARYGAYVYSWENREAENDHAR